MTGYTLVDIDESDSEDWAEGTSGVWKRIERWLDWHRFGVRDVVVYARMGIVSSEGWVPPLGPLHEIEKVEVFRGDTWQTVQHGIGPFGGITGLQHFDAVKLTAKVGHEETPPAVMQAFHRLDEFLNAETKAPVGASSYSIGLGSGELSESYSLPIERFTRAITLSGAADLLRPWRKTR